MTILLQYNGLDWLTMALSLLALWLLSNKNRFGFAAFMLANVIWILLGVWLIQSVGIVVGNVVFLIMNIRGYLRWKTPQANGPSI